MQLNWLEADFLSLVLNVQESKSRMTSSVMEAAASASSSPNDPPPPSAWSSAPREPILPSLRGAIFRRSEELERSNLSSRVCVVLHGHGMTAKDMEDWADHLGLFQEDMHYVFLQAPSQWYAPASRFLPSWFTYTKEHEGVAEDEICKTAADAMLSGVAVSVKMALQHLDCKADLAETVCAGFSEGGCVALELASFVPFKAVFTLVSHRRSERARAPLLCPWYALTAKGDTVYDPSWALQHLGSTRYWETVDDEHYLHSSDESVRGFLLKCFRDA